MTEATKYPETDPGIALALGSAFLGVYAHGGLVCGLNQAGIFPGHVAGASAGALAGGFYAAGLRESELEDACLSAALKRSYPDPFMLLRAAPLGLGRLTGIMDGKRVVRHLKAVLPVSKIEEAPGVKLSIAVTDLYRSEAVFLKSGSLAEAIMASCAVPVLFSGQEIAGRIFHDGGVMHDVPLEPFLTDPDIHTIIMHKISYAGHRKNKRLGVRSALLNGRDMLNAELLEHRMEAAKRHGKRVILLETSHAHPGFLQSQATKKRYFEDGYQTAASSSAISSISRETSP